MQINILKDKIVIDNKYLVYKDNGAIYNLKSNKDIPLKVFNVAKRFLSKKVLRSWLYA